MSTHVKPKRKGQDGKLLHRVLRCLYNYRGWWVDAPTLSLLGLYHWHFYSLGIHPIPEKMPEFCWAILGMYWLIKEGVRWILKGIQSRRGSFLVAIWLVSALEFFFMMQLHHPIYQMPPQMIETTLIIICGFLGLLPVKRAFYKKFPKVVDRLSNDGE